MKTKTNMRLIEEAYVNMYESSGDIVQIDIDYDYSDKKEAKKNERKFNIRIRPTNETMVCQIEGDKNDIIEFLEYNEYEDLEELYPELF